MSDYTGLVARLAVATAQQPTTALADTVHEAEVAIVALSDRVEKAEAKVARLEARVELACYTYFGNSVLGALDAVRASLIDPKASGA